VNSNLHKTQLEGDPERVGARVNFPNGCVKRRSRAKCAAENFVNFPLISTGTGLAIVF
jgi:hypothetical protein